MSPDTDMEEASAAAYMYEQHPSSDLLRIDDLLDFSNEEIFDTTSSDASSNRHFPLPESSLPSAGIPDSTPFRSHFEDLSVPVRTENKTLIFLSVSILYVIIYLIV